MNNSTENNFTLAIDIGNTRSHFGIIDNNALSCIASVAIPSDSVPANLVPTVLELLGRYDKTMCGSIVIASCIRSLSKISYSKLNDLFPGKVMLAGYSKKLPFGCNYKKPFTLGVDRLAQALYGSVLFENTDLILISAGTAVTIDLLYKNNLAGGVILPGLRTQLISLQKQTDALPFVKNEELSHVSLPGTTTVECISAGVLYGIAGAIERIVGEYKKSADQSIVLATGGDWEVLSPYISFVHKHISNMTLIGTALFRRFI